MSLKVENANQVLFSSGTAYNGFNRQFLSHEPNFQMSLWTQ